MFKNQQQNTPLPEINLVPMMDVLMTVLTFFILLSMTLTGQGVPNVFLPKVQDGTGAGGNGETVPKNPPKRLVLGLNNQGKIVLNNQVVDETQMKSEIQSFLAENPEGIITLNADRTLNYQQIDSLLVKMQDVGGQQVSLAIE
jgi:biopolymer transport protein ExbD